MAMYYISGRASGAEGVISLPFRTCLSIEYTGKAPTSTYLNVEETKKNVGAPEVKEKGEAGIKDDMIGEGEKATDSEEKSVLSSAAKDSQNKPEDAVMHGIQGEIQPVASTQSNKTPSASALAPEPTLESIISTSSTTLPSALSSLNTLLPSTSTSSLPNANSLTLKPRFKSTFRGRTIQGLTVDLPPGYTGVILCSTDDDAPTTKTKAALATAKMSEKVRARRKATVAKGKGKIDIGVEDVEVEIETEKRTTRRSTRSSVIDVDALEDDKDDSEVAGTTNANTLGNTRTLQPTSRFSSFVLWHPDIPVDEGRDEYYGALDEWVAIAHAVHCVPED
ncbi:hypothetical protein VKT23_017696 [Stygiomarasmius scandens]|uniref:Uncharacterized protein n=1 Tax=Marasmiellus scandens TaxID=2682957 RepID=A0ABR1IRL1_9AGAR